LMKQPNKSLYKARSALSERCARLLAQKMRYKQARIHISKHRFSIKLSRSRQNFTQIKVEAQNFLVERKNFFQKCFFCLKSIF